MIVGVDPGLVSCAFVAVGRQGGRWRLFGEDTAKTQRASKTPDRVHFICARFLAFVSEQRPALVCIEEQTLVQQGKSQRGETHYRALVVRDVQYALAGVAWARDLPVRFVSPQRAKRAVTGSGSATKAQVRHAIAARVGATLAEHAADAVAVAIAGEAEAHLSGAMVRSLPGSWRRSS